jgi:NADPH2:quinone reductase
MRAILCREHGGPEGLVLADLPVPDPGACHVGLRVRAAGLNFADLLMLRGKYQEQPALPFVPGLEVAGEIDRVGVGVDGLEAGQRVMAVLSHGGLAERAVAVASDVVPLPDHIDDATAAGFAIAYGTAHGALRWRADLHAGETLLVHGAAGGVGLTAVEVGKALGAIVIATARGADKLAVARSHGADHALDSDGADLREQIKALTDGRGVDVVFDPVGGPMFDLSLRTIAWEGRIVLVGFASGKVPQIPANILLVKNAAAFGFYWGSYRKHDPERLRASFRELFRWHAEGRIRPRVTTLPLEKAPEALQGLADRSTTGKVVLTID